MSSSLSNGPLVGAGVGRPSGVGAAPPSVSSSAGPAAPAAGGLRGGAGDAAAFAAAKAYLTTATDNGVSVYDHISNVIYTILEQKPQDALQAFETISGDVKRGHFVQPHPLRDEPPAVSPQAEQVAKLVTGAKLALFKPPVPELDDNNEVIEPAEPNDGILPDIMADATAFEAGGVGLGREEMYRIMLHMKNLVEQNPLSKVRFFGKIIGSQQDYLVCESEFYPNAWPKDDDVAGDEEDLSALVAGDDDDGTNNDSANGGVAPDPVIRPTVKREPVAPKEVQSGPNKYTYWVCSFPGDPWVRLPDVTPAQIVCARQVTKFFTGDLDAAVVTFPPFPGTERHLLRAQIARIAAATMVCPAGYFQKDPDADDNDDDEDDASVLSNHEYELPAEIDNLEADSWVHYYRHILPQGRTQWWAPPRDEKAPRDDDDDYGDDDDDDNGPQPEVGPRLLAPVALDAPVGSFPAWSLRTNSDKTRGRFTIYYLRSNRWPGAVAYATETKSSCIYVGYGQKYLGAQYTPPLPPAPASEYILEEETRELADPTVEDEDNYQRMIAGDMDGDGSGVYDGGDDDLSSDQ